MTVNSNTGQSVAFSTCGYAYGASATYAGTSGGTWHSDPNDPTSYADYALSAIENLPQFGELYEVKAGIWTDNGYYNLNKCEFYETYVYSGGTGNAQSTCAKRESTLPLTGSVKLSSVAGESQWEVDFPDYRAFASTAMGYSNLLMAGVEEGCTCFGQGKVSSSGSPKVYSSSLQYEANDESWGAWGAYSHCFLQAYESPYQESIAGVSGVTFPTSVKNQLGTGLGSYGSKTSNPVCDGSTATMPRSGSW